MNLDHPQDLAPLSYGCGLALGLMLLLGLPAAPRPSSVPRKVTEPARHPCPARLAATKPAPTAVEAICS